MDMLARSYQLVSAWAVRPQPRVFDTALRLRHCLAVSVVVAALRRGATYCRRFVLDRAHGFSI